MNIIHFSPTEHDFFCKVNLPFGSQVAGGRSISAGFSTIHAGDLALNHDKARNRLFGHLGIAGSRIFSLIQSHGRTVHVYDCNSEVVGNGDSAVTSVQSAVLSITVADCLPIFLYDATKHVFAIAHSGWKGTGIATHVVDTMVREFQSKQSEIDVLIGPGIGDCCYNVPESRARYMEKFGEGVAIARDGEFYLSLQNANINLLKKHGIVKISVIDHCTSCSGFLGSYRRQGPESFTRMVAVIGYF